MLLSVLQEMTSPMSKPLDCVGEDSSDGPSIHKSHVEQLSLEQSLIEIARHCCPVVLIKQLDIARYSDSLLQLLPRLFFPLFNEFFSKINTTVIFQFSKDLESNKVHSNLANGDICSYAKEILSVSSIVFARWQHTS